MSSGLAASIRAATGKPLWILGNRRVFEIITIAGHICRQWMVFISYQHHSNSPLNEPFVPQYYKLF